MGPVLLIYLHTHLAGVIPAIKKLNLNYGISDASTTVSFSRPGPDLDPASDLAAQLPA